MTDSTARVAIEAVEKGSLQADNLALVVREAKVMQSIRDVVADNIQTDYLDDDEAEQA